MTLRIRPLPYTGERRGWQQRKTETRRSVKGMVGYKQLDRMDVPGPSDSYDAKRRGDSRVVSQEGQGQATTGMVIQEGDSVLSVLPFICYLEATCRSPKSKFRMVWPSSPSHI